jgi:large subunit ribosomal protein L29
MRVDELRVLEADELSVRLRTARRELYELRFKHAVGQLDNSSQISKVRHDIARIMTVQRQREYGIGPTLEEALQEQQAAVAVAEPVPVAEAEPEAEAPKPKRARRAKKDESA